MAFPALIPADQMPLNTLFPEHYERSKKMIVKDFILLGSTIVFAVVFAAAYNLATS